MKMLVGGDGLPQEDQERRRSQRFAAAIVAVCMGCTLLYGVLGMWASSAGAVACALALGVVPLLARVRVGPMWLGISLLAVLLVGDVPTQMYAISSTEDAVRLVIHTGLVALTISLAWLYKLDQARQSLALADSARALAQVREEARGQGEALAAARAEASEAGGRLQAAHEEVVEAWRVVQLLLDSVDQAVLLVEPSGAVAEPRSRAFEALFGSAPPSVKIWELLAGEPALAEALQGGWPALFSAQRPAEVLSSLPTQLRPARGRPLTLRWVPVLDQEQLSRVLLVAGDASPALALEAMEQEKAELVEVARWLARDRASWSAFQREARRMVAAVVGASDVAAPEQRLYLEMLESDAALFGLRSLASCCQSIEAELESEGREITPAQRERLTGAWKATRTTFERLSQGADLVAIDRREHAQLLEAAASLDRERLLERVTQWAWEPVSVHLARLGALARAHAARRGLPPPSLKLEDRGVRLPERWGAFWTAAGHVLRNALDHGIEPPVERLASGKPEAGEISIEVSSDAQGVIVSFRDDGRGIAWDRVAAAARAQDRPADTVDDLVGALFVDGLSTSGGRGLGMGAVWAAADKLGGAAQVESFEGRGAAFRFWFPREALLQVE